MSIRKQNKTKKKPRLRSCNSKLDNYLVLLVWGAFCTGNVLTGHERQLLWGFFVPFHSQSLFRCGVSFECSIWLQTHYKSKYISLLLCLISLFFNILMFWQESILCFFFFYFIYYYFLFVCLFFVPLCLCTFVWKQIADLWPCWCWWGFWLPFKQVCQIVTVVCPSHKNETYLYF